MMSQVECKFEYTDVNTPFSLTFLENTMRSYSLHVDIIIFGKLFSRHSFRGSLIQLPRGVL